LVPNSLFDFPYGVVVKPTGNFLTTTIYVQDIQADARVDVIKNTQLDAVEININLVQSRSFSWSPLAAQMVVKIFANAPSPQPWLIASFCPEATLIPTE
jgi:hypothetical protein